MRTIKGNLEQLTTVSQNSETNGEKLYVQSFKINNIEIELITEKSINVKEGDQVLVAGIQGVNKVFKAFSLKNLS